MGKKIAIFLGFFAALLLAANYNDIKEKLTSKNSFNFDHSNFGIDVVEGESTDELLQHFGKNDLEKEEGEEDPYYLEPSISLKERVFCRGGIGKAASCKERPINPYWENWTLHYGSPESEDSVAKQKYEEKYKGYQKTRRLKQREGD